MPKNPLRFYFSFNGRATRDDLLLRFWPWAILSVVLLRCVAAASDILFFIPFLWQYTVFYSCLALTCRRLHDAGRSGWNQIFIMPIPFVIYGLAVWILGLELLIDRVWSSVIVILALLCFGVVYFIFVLNPRGTDGPNRFGPDPLQKNFFPNSETLS